MGLNFPPMIWSLMGILGIGDDDHNNCSKAKQWLSLEFALTGANITASLYLVYQTSKHTNREDMNENRNMNNTNTNTNTYTNANNNSEWKDTMHILCYDPWIAGYILSLIVFLIWLIKGVAWLGNGSMEECSQSSRSHVSNSIGCGFAYISCGIISLLFCLCLIACCGGNNNGRSTTYQDFSNGFAYHSHDSHNQSTQYGTSTCTG
eukprot:CAMPEP_0184866216 /NCGR_PEP_ID=MMETSP0580-20130426/21340_1 /TAXON_ID=1118495 /ORGANISM="Dactyliosolen fragilissimus" /LENGTH=205 /DNA_ID=CAMNT_0027365763 /DNA_START=237 /DNA_END=850 /DNA_ORIENTATION=-